MTGAAHLTPDRTETLEQQRDAAAARYSRTSKERVEVARLVNKLEIAYGLQAGRGFVAWLEKGGFGHSTAINLRNAGRALASGMESTADSVTELAELGALLNRGKPRDEVKEIQQGNAARRVLAQEAGIGLNSAPFPSEHIDEVAAALVAVKQGYEKSNLTIPDTPELTLMMARIVNDTPNLPALVARMEGSPPAPLPLPGILAPLAYYSHLAGRTPRTCQHPRCGAPAAQLHHVPIWDDLPKRGHALESANVLDLCLRHHQTGGHAAAHGPAGFERWAEEGWGSTARLFAAMFREYVIWTQALLDTRTAPQEATP